MIATPAQIAAKTVRNRAPKGGMVSPVNGLFYRGGWFMPTAIEGRPTVEGPARLEGSSRQVPWAEKIRRQELARVEAELAGLLHAIGTAPKVYRAWMRSEIERSAIERHRMLAERSASAWIGMRVGG